MNKSTAIAITLIAATLIFSSCHEKGCTNRNAINYNVTADQDDGSCIFCTATVTNLSSNTGYLIDNNFESAFYEDTVAVFNFTQPESSFSYSECGTGVCTVNLTVVSRVNKTMFIECQVEGEGPEEFGSEINITVPPNGSFNDGVITTLQSPFNPINEDEIFIDEESITYSN